MTHGNSSSSSIPTLPSSSTSTNSGTNSSQFFQRESDDFGGYVWELKGAKLAIMSFTINEKKTISVHLCMENMSQWRSAKSLAVCSGKTTLSVSAEMLFSYSELTRLCMLFPLFHTLEGFFRK